MQDYQARKIEFKELFEVGDWKIKIYTISKIGNFNYPEFYETVKLKLPEWLLLKNNFDSSNNKIGFLILHSGTEGIFSLINWWVGKNMLNTHIFITSPIETSDFKQISGDGLAPCVWELEVINHERISWTKNILKHPSKPKFGEYVKDIINKEI